MVRIAISVLLLAALTGCYVSRTKLYSGGDSVGHAGAYRCKNGISGKIQQAFVRVRSSGVWPLRDYAYDITIDGKRENPMTMHKVRANLYIVQQRAPRQGGYSYTFLHTFGDRSFVLMTADTVTKEAFLNNLLRQHRLRVQRRSNGPSSYYILVGTDGNKRAFLESHSLHLMTGILNCHKIGRRAARTPPKPARPAPKPSGSDSIRLTDYPLMSQLDPKSYRDPDFMNVPDTIAGSSKTVEIKKLACLATVYAIIARGRGEKKYVDDFYIDPRKPGANGEDARRPAWVESESTLNAEQVRQALQQGTPVILHGVGGPLKEHFVLAIGINRKEIIAIDPWPSSENDPKGSLIRVRLGTDRLAHPNLPITFTKMRNIKKVADTSARKGADADKSKPLNDVYRTVERFRKEAPKRTDPRKPARRQTAGRSAPLSMSEIDALRRQIQPCWYFPANRRRTGPPVVRLRLELRRDGSLISAKVSNPARMATDSDFRAVAEAALRAVRNPSCTPLKLPAHKYDQWKSLTIEFDPAKLGL